MKMKTTPRPPTPRRVPRRMVKTLHARAAASEKDFEEFESETEPSMRFSHALIVVLVLHVLAVGGVFAFNSLKGRHIAPERTKPAVPTASASTPDVVAATGKKAAAPAREAGALPAAQSKTTVKSQQEAEFTTHTVVVGDTLARIAIGHKTTVEALQQANAIGNNSSLRVGQVLKVPAKSQAVKTPAKPETAAPKTTEVKAPTSAKTAEAKPAPAAKTAEAKPAAVEKSSEAKPISPAKPADSKTAAKAAEAKPAASAVKNPEAKPTPVAKTTETTAPPKPAAAEVSKADPKPNASDKTYTVAKGDNPYSIAKKLKVSYNELIKTNDIKDPTKLQIGQKLIVP